MNIDGKDMEMRTAICYGKEYDKWLVSRCGVVWSLKYNRLLKGGESWRRGWRGSKVLNHVTLCCAATENFWEDGSGYKRSNRPKWQRQIKYHKVVMDTWAPLYDNPPEGIVWEEWEIVRDLPTVFNHISKAVVIDHIDDDPTNNHLDNLRRVTQWDNNRHRKAKGI